MPPITWRTVTGPSVAEAARPFEIARQSIGDGFSALQKVLDSRNAGEAEQAKVVQDTNTAAYQDLVGKITRPEDAAAMAPQLEAQRALLTPAAKQATRGAVDERTAAVMKQISDRQQFDRAQLTEQFRPQFDTAMMEAVQGNKDKALGLLNAIPEGVPNRAELMKSIVEGDHSRIKWDQEQKRFTWQEADEAQRVLLRPLEIEAKKAGIESSRASTAASQAATRASLQQIKAGEISAVKLLGELDNASRQRIISESPLAFGTLDSQAGRQALNQYLKDNIKNDDQRSDIIANLEKYFPNGQMKVKGKDGREQLIQVPVLPLLDAIGASGENPLASIIPGWSRRGDDMHNRLMDTFEKDPGIFERMAAAKAATNQINNRDEQTRQLVESIVNNKVDTTGRRR